MKFVLITIALTFALTGGVFSQHCPFDGGEMLVVELVDHKGEPMFGASMDLTLAETDNPKADECKYSPGLVKREFRSPIEAYLTRYRQSTDLFADLCRECTFNKDGFYAVVIGQGERTCFAEGEDGVSTDRPRSYELRYSREGTEQKMKVERKDFFSMCTDGKWSRFRPLRFQIGKD